MQGAAFFSPSVVIPCLLPKKNASDLICCYLGTRSAKKWICNEESIKLLLRWDYFLKVTVCCEALLAALRGLTNGRFTISAYEVPISGSGAFSSVFCPSSPFPLFPVLSLIPTRSWDGLGSITGLGPVSSFPAARGRPVFDSLRESMWCSPMITSRNFLKRLPCSGFVKKSASICSVGQCWTSMSSMSMRL